MPCCCCCDPFQLAYFSAAITIVQAVAMGALNCILIAINQCLIPPPDDLPDYEPARMIWGWFLFDNETCAARDFEIKPNHWIYDYSEGSNDSLTSPANNYAYQITYLILHIFWILSSIVLIYGNARRRPVFYFPWILITFTLLVMDIVIASFFINEIVDNWRVTTSFGQFWDNSKITLAIIGPVLFYLRGVAFWIHNCVDAGNVIMAFCWARKKSKKRKELKQAKREAALANQRLDEALRINQGGGRGGNPQQQEVLVMRSVPVETYPAPGQHPQSRPPRPPSRSEFEYRRYANVPGGHERGGRYDYIDSEREYFEGAEPPRPPPAPRELRPFSYLNPVFQPLDSHDIVGMKSNPASEYEKQAYEEDLRKAKELIRKKSSNLPSDYKTSSQTGNSDSSSNEPHPPVRHNYQKSRASPEYATPWDKMPKKDPSAPGEYHQHLHVTQSYSSVNPHDHIHSGFSRSFQPIQNPNQKYENPFNDYPQQASEMAQNGLHPSQGANYPVANIYENIPLDHASRNPPSLTYPTRIRPTNHRTEIPRNPNLPQLFLGENTNLVMTNSNPIMGARETKTEDANSAVNNGKVAGDVNRGLRSLPLNGYPEQVSEMAQNGLHPSQGANYPVANIYENITSDHASRNPPSLTYPTRIRPTNHRTEIPRNPNLSQPFQGDNINLAMTKSNPIMGDRETKTEDANSAVNNGEVTGNRNRSLSSLPEGNSRKYGEKASLNELITAVGNTNEEGKNVSSGYNNQSLGRSSVTGMAAGGVAVAPLRRDATARLSKRLRKNRGRSENPRPQWEEQWKAMRSSRRKYGRVRALQRPTQTPKSLSKQVQGVGKLNSAQRHNTQHSQTPHQNNQQHIEQSEDRPVQQRQPPHQNPQQINAHRVNSNAQIERRAHLPDVHSTQRPLSHQELNTRVGGESGHTGPQVEVGGKGGYMGPETDNYRSAQLHSTERGPLSLRQPMPRTNAWVHPHPMKTRTHHQMSSQTNQPIPSSQPQLPPYPSTQTQTPFYSPNLPGPSNDTQPLQVSKPKQLQYPSTQAQTSFHPLNSSHTTVHASNQVLQPSSSQSKQFPYPPTQAQTSFHPQDTPHTLKLPLPLQTPHSHNPSREEREAFPSTGMFHLHPQSFMNEAPPLPRRFVPGEPGPSPSSVPAAPQVVRDPAVWNQQEGVIRMRHTHPNGNRHDFGESSI